MAHRDLRFVVCAIVCALAVIAGACGGGDDDVATTDADDAPVATEPTVVTPTREPTSIAVVIPTSTPLPTATALPTSTPVPLEAPTPSAILLDAAFTNSSKVTTVGIDEVFFGMTPEQAGEAASTDWIGERSSTSNCYRIAPSKGPQGVEFWVVDGFIERVDIAHPDLRTPSQLGLGLSLADLQGQLGDRLTSEVDDAGSGEAVFTPADAGDADFRLIFELENDSVVRYRSGRVGVVDRADCFSSTTSTE